MLKHCDFPFENQQEVFFVGLFSIRYGRSGLIKWANLSMSNPTRPDPTRPYDTFENVLSQCGGP